MVDVIRPESIARLELVQAPAEQFGADVRSDPRVLAPPPGALLNPIPLVSVEVEDIHARETRR
jgi:hypothetical protein